MTRKQKTATQYRQTQLIEFKEYEHTARALERLRQKHLEFILKLKGAKKEIDKKNRKNRNGSVLFLCGSEWNQNFNIQTKSHDN